MIITPKNTASKSKGRSAAETARLNPLKGPGTGAGTGGKFSLQDATKGIGGNIKGIFNKATDFLSNPSLSRLGISGLLPGGQGKAGGGLPNIQFGTQGGSGLSAEQDWRVRVTAAPAGPFNFGAGPLTALGGDNGVVFPFTPNISVSHNANYGSVAPTHSNYPSYFYDNSDVSAINITTEFTAQTADDANYVLGMIWFFRSATKMFYQGPNAGNPPPVVYLDGYGDYYFPHVSCVVTNFTHTMPSNIDYIETTVEPGQSTTVAVSGGVLPNNLQAPFSIQNSADFQTGLATAASALGNGFGAGIQTPKQNLNVATTGKKARIPTKSTISLSLQPIYSRRSVTQQFTWEDFSAGALLRDNGGFL
jgi:hypothetical protein